MKKAYERLVKRIYDPKIDFQERAFLILTIVAWFALGTVTLFDVLIGENLLEIIALCLMLVTSPIFVYISVNFGKLKIGSLLIAACMIFILIPVSFYFGGGLTGGSVVWVAFSYLYIGLILTGRTRFVMLTLLTFLTIFEYASAYFKPELVIEHSKAVWYMDSGISVLLVGSVIFVMLYFYNKLYSSENKKALDQAKQIDELNKAQNRFFSNMSHEIRTPINTIIGLNEMILRENISDEVAEDAKNIRSASGILLSLINDILDMSKIESGKMDIVNVPYDVEKMLRDIVNMIVVRAKEKGLKFRIDVDPTMPSKLFCDEVRIRQILINILNNAVKYTNEGSVNFSVHCRKTDAGKALVSYSVEDTGMGIRKESIPHLFDAFKREDEEKNRYIEGTGLGLSIVKQLVDLLGGEISVNSVYTKGSTFIVTIEQEISEETPIGRFEIEKVRGAANNINYHQSFEAKDANVLIVDDNSTNILVAKKLLRDTKVSIDTALSGAECLKFTVSKHYDAILMDHLMPEMDGIEALHAIREQAGGLNRTTPVIVLTANAGSENKLLYKKAGFDGYLLKPVSGELLEATLLEILPEDLVHLTKTNEEKYESDTILREMRKKVPLLITTDSVSDIPRELLLKHKIPVLPYRVYMNERIFTDGVEVEGEVIVKYMEDKSVVARSEAPEVEEYEEFFSEQLTNAQHIVHIAMAKNSSKGFANACEAALAFYNVKVIDSGQLSSGMGIMALYAKELADKPSMTPELLVDEIMKLKNKINTNFIVDSTEYLNRSGRVSDNVHRICRSLMLHPMIDLKDSGMKVGKIFIGNRAKARKDYIKSVLRDRSEIDDSVLFITYVGMKRSEIDEIIEEVRKYVDFKKVYAQKASPAISINSGPGTFGLLFSRR